MLGFFVFFFFFPFLFSPPARFCYCDRYLRKQCNESKCLFWLMVSIHDCGSVVSGPVVRQSITAEGCGEAKLLISIASEKQREQGPGHVPSDLLPSDAVIYVLDLTQQNSRGEVGGGGSINPLSSELCQ